MTDEIDIRPAGTDDLDSVAALAHALWPDSGASELARELSPLLDSDDARIFLACAPDGAVGFAQCQLRRDYVEGADSSPTGYLEGIFVAPGYRGRGLGRALCARCEDWARERGCRGFASDCELDNLDSLGFHLASGFREANRIICFIKEL